MEETVTFSSGILFHDMTALIDIRNCIFNIDLLVLQELYVLIKYGADESLKKQFSTLIPFIESAKGNFSKLSPLVQMKDSGNPILDFYQWPEHTADVSETFQYCDALYNRLYYEESNTLQLIPIPTLLGNLFSMSLKLDEFKKLYLLDYHCPQHIRHHLELLFKGSSKVEILEGTLGEVVNEISDINFFVLNNVDSVQYLMKPRSVRAEVLIPAFRCNLLNGDNLSEEPPVLALPNGMDNYGAEFNLSINSIAVPI